MTLELGGWLDADEVDEACSTDAMRHRSVGYLFRETAEALALVQSRNAASTDENRDTRVGGVQVIPRAAVLAVHRLARGV
ncbi:MAG: hypothetical protein ACRDM0_26645, partial [Thermoleophilaceae bacterium]